MTILTIDPADFPALDKATLQLVNAANKVALSHLQTTSNTTINVEVTIGDVTIKVSK